MASEGNYKLSGTGVQISDSAGPTAREVVLDDSFREMTGIHQVSGPAISETHLDEYCFAVGGTIDHEIRITRQVLDTMFPFGLVHND